MFRRCLRRWWDMGRGLRDSDTRQCVLFELQEERYRQIGMERGVQRCFAQVASALKLVAVLSLQPSYSQRSLRPSDVLGS
jgi:hypothetical protein